MKTLTFFWMELFVACTVLAEEFPDSIIRAAAAFGIVDVCTFLLGYFDLNDMKIIITY
ncbi:MAG: hypothetical protein ACJ70T_07250 [Nitrososphaera sp.]